MAHQRLTANFFDLPALDLCKKLLGKRLVRKDEFGNILSGRIVETEAYPGRTDKASHSHKGRTGRNGAMFMDPGTAYVYIIYGMYYCFNISSKEKGGAVLIRAIEPVSGLDIMQVSRSKKPGKSPLKRTKPLKDHELCSGPSKLCQALGINKVNSDKMVLTNDDSIIWLENDQDISEEDIVVSTRVGIDGCGAEYASLPYRFYVRDCKSVSVKEVKKRKAKYNEQKWMETNMSCFYMKIMHFMYWNYDMYYL